MAGYIGAKQGVTQVDGYNRSEADAEFVQTAGDTMTGALAVNGNLTVDTNTLFVDAANNRVGVGTSSPSAPLSVYNASNPYANFADAANYLNVGVITSNYGLINSSLPISFQISDTERARIDASGNLLVGGTTAGNAGTVSINVGNAGATAGGLQMWAGTAQTSFVQFGDESGTAANHYRGYIAYAHGSDSMQFGTASTERMRITSTGNLLVNTTSATGNSKFVVSANSDIENPMSVVSTKTAAGGEYAIIFYRGVNIVGSVQTTLSGTSYVTSSDYRLKENVVPLAGAADRIAQIPVHRFNFIADPDTTVDGFLAHEVQAFVPECVTGEKDQVETVEVTDEDGNVTTETRPVHQGIDQSKLVPLLTAALQEALARIETLEADVAALKGEPA